MSERRDVATLLDFIMDELIELSGAERALLVIASDDKAREVAAGRGFESGQERQLLAQVSDLLDAVDRSHQPVLRQDLDENDLSAVTQDRLTSLSVLCVPLVSRGQLIGSFYADNHVLYGRFTQADVDLLSAFANQVAAAIENARLYQSLEQRVAERTADLQAVNTSLGQRNAELAVITSVQQGLAAQLDFNAIIELVGEKIRRVFNAQGIGIALYDRRTNIVTHPYSVDDDQRISLDANPLGTGLP
jgi:GAF domain-containing protein